MTKKINIDLQLGKVGKIVQILACILCCCPATDKVHAQTLANSPYSYFGVGNIFKKGSSHNRSLGSTGIGLRDGYSINNINPASYTAITPPFTQLTEVGVMTTFGIQEEKGKSSNVTDMDFTGMALWFRLHANWAASIGLTPYSNVQYNIISEESFTGLGGDITSHYVGSGGLNNLYFGLAHTLFNHLSLGAHVSYIFGSLNAEQQITASNMGNAWNVTERTYLHAFKVDVGMQYAFRWKQSELIVGAVLDVGNDLQGTHYYEVSQSEEITEEEETTVDDYILPAAAGFGLSWSRYEKWRIALDVAAERWSDATFAEGYQLQDTQRFSVGVETLPDPQDPSYLRRMSFSLGAFHEENYLVISDHDLTTNGISAGIKFPTAGASRLHFTIEHYISGNNNLIVQRYTQLGFNMSFFDLWFAKLRLE